MMNPGLSRSILLRFLVMAALGMPMLDFFSGTARAVAEENAASTSGAGMAMAVGAEEGSEAAAVPNGSGNTGQALKICIAAREKAEAASAQFQAEAAQLGAARDAMAAEVEKLRHESERVRLENQEVKDRRGIKWFLAGGGILLLGYLIGQAGGSGRRYKSTLLK